MTPVNPLATTVTPSGMDSPVRTGQVLEGKFRVERIIGEGAMGLVVEATHLALDERVALKFLRPEARARPDIVTRFAREARAAAKIKSDHVARVFDVGGTEDGTPFIVMEYLQGYDLEQILLNDGFLEITDAVEHVIQACEGLTAAHMHGIVHRDIKPANLFIAERAGGRQVKLLDFGISKAGITFEEVDVSSPNTTQIMGSPHYMSPEQIRSTKDVDSRADIWSLGVVLYELLAGQTPFMATEVTTIIAKVLHEPHSPIRTIRPHLPVELETIINRCLDKDPTLRFQTAADLAIALLPFAPKSARSVAEKASAIVRTAHTPHTPYDDSPDSLPPPRTRPMSGGVAGAAGPSGTLMLGPPPTPLPQTNSQSAVAVPSQAPQRQNSATIYVALAAVIIGLAGGIFAIVARFRAPPPPITIQQPVVAAPQAPTPPPVETTPTPAPTPTPSETATAAPSETAAVAPVSAAHTPVPIPIPVVTRRPVVTPASSPRSAAPSGPENEIRHER